MCVETTGDETRQKPFVTKTKPLRVAVAGLGVVGEGAVFEVLAHDDFVFAGALVRNAGKSRDSAINAALVHTDIEALLASSPDIVIDALSDGEAGRKLIEASLRRGASVISANKQAVAGALGALHALARDHGASFAYSSSVGGGAPMIETVREAAADGEIVAIKAILNGTVNFILTSMKRGADFDEAVRQAQAAGFAEADPSADLSGLDAKAKISILIYEAFGTEPELDDIVVQGLDNAAATAFSNAQGDWRQVSRVEKRNGKMVALLAYECVDDDPLFSKADGEGNVMRAKTVTGAMFECAGRGAGRQPTVASIFADLAVINAKIKAEGFSPAD